MTREPDLPLPGKHTHYVSGEKATIVASSWMADPNDDGVWIAVVVLLNQDPDYYTVAWLQTAGPDDGWEATDATTYPSIIDAARAYEEITR